jgi:hypothetical protein
MESSSAQQQSQNSEPAKQPQSPTPEELAATRAKNIEAVRQLLTPEEWVEVREAAYAEAETANIRAFREELARFKSSIGRLYGHFNNVMIKWKITALNPFGKEQQDRPVPGVAVAAGENRSRAPEEAPPSSLPLVKPKGKTVYRFDPAQPTLIPVPETPGPEPKTSVPPPPPSAPVKKKRAPSRFPRKLAPAKEIAWRRELMEKQLKLRPSTLDEILSRLSAEGFPVSKPYYAEIVAGRRPRLRTLVAADLYLLICRKVLRGDGKGRYAWARDLPNRYKSSYK